MSVLRFIRRPQKRIEKKFDPATRIQFNFMCTRELAQRVKTLANLLEVPIYPLLEHTLELGLMELGVALDDQTSKEHLLRHLVQNHLLTPVIKPESDLISQRALRMENALKLLRILESRVTQEQLQALLERLLKGD
ncbi:MAG: hypothetical protein Q8O16_03230 [Dehalococcoidia bacterium]|nr:hypothetical protein [Dehalococcoidia bacterium]